MAADTIKTRPTGADVRAFLDAVDNDRRRHDAFEVLDMMTRISGCPPRMWGPSIVGFDQYHYKYDSGREGDMCLVFFCRARLAWCSISWAASTANRR